MKKSDVIKLIEKHIPTNWLHPLLSGDRKAIHQAPFYNRDIEKLCLEIKRDMLKELNSVNNVLDDEVKNED